MGENADDESGDQDVEKHAQFHDQRHAVGGRRCAQKQPVFHHQEPDHLGHRFFSGDHCEEADEHDRQRDGEGVLGEEEPQTDDGLGNVEGQDDQRAANQKRGRNIDVEDQLTRDVQALDDFFQDPGDDNHFDDHGEESRDVDMVNPRQEGHQCRRDGQKCGLQREQVHAGREPPLRDDRKARQEQEGGAQVHHLRRNVRTDRSHVRPSGCRRTRPPTGTK